MSPPFRPNQTSKGEPTVCHCCGRHATGIGIGQLPNDPRWLCEECILLIERIRAVRRWDPYEKKALEGGMESAGPLVEEFGADLSEWSEEQVMQFVSTIWRGCVDRLHKVLEDGDAPF